MYQISLFSLRLILAFEKSGDFKRQTVSTENTFQLTITMNDPQFHQHGGPHPQHRPSWKRVHHSPFFWMSALFILIAMIVYVTTENLAFRQGRPPQNATPVIAP